jgi:hypothetical protein
MIEPFSPSRTAISTSAHGMPSRRARWDAAFSAQSSPWT